MDIVVYQDTLEFIAIFSSLMGEKINTLHLSLQKIPQKWKKSNFFWPFINKEEPHVFMKMNIHISAKIQVWIFCQLYIFVI